MVFPNVIQTFVNQKRFNSLILDKLEDFIFILACMVIVHVTMAIRRECI